MSEYKRLTKQAGWHKDIDLKDELGYSYIYQRLAELENKIEQGTLIELPCKVGDTIWGIEGFCDDSYGIIERVVGYLVVFANSIDIHASKPNTLGITRAYDTGKIGKTVFLTREEAEKRLKELQG